MNKLILFCLLSLMILYAQCGDEDCANHTPTTESPCSSVDLGANKVCNVDPNDASKCAPVDKAQTTPEKSTKKDTKSTNSSDILNIFKISFALLIIFTIL